MNLRTLGEVPFSPHPHMIVREWAGKWWRQWSDEPDHWRGPFDTQLAAEGHTPNLWPDGEPKYVLVWREDGTAEWCVL